MKRIMSSISTKLALIVMSSFIIMIICITGVTIYVYRMDSIKDFSKQAMDISNALAVSIDGDEYKNLIETQEKNEYWTKLLNMFSNTKQQTGFNYIYAIDTAPSGIFRYVVEGYIDSDDMSEIYDLGEVANSEDFDDGVEITLVEKVPMVSDIYIYDGEKTITGYAPIFDSSNNIVGIVGADVSLKTITSEVIKFASITGAIGGCVAILFLILIYYYIKQHVGKPIAGLANSASEIAEGNLNINMIKVRRRKHKDEIAILADSFTKFTSTITDITNEINILSDKHEEGDLEYFIDSEKYKGAYAEVAISANTSIKSYIDLTYDMLSAIEKLAEGDFSYDMKQYKGKRSNINAGMSSLKQTFDSIATDIKTLVDSGRNGNLTTRIKSDTYLGVWKDIIHSLNKLMATIAAPITEAVVALDAISYGNFDNRINNEYNGDFNKIALSLNYTSETIS
ncbi:MAG: HAMP domain-containing protein, partial [Clostridiales bacterium]|nr:HAMP domain-containing protein [Clostridiales bacterium]